MILRNKTMKKYRLVAHLDLKGIQYRPDHYEAYFDNLRHLGYDAVLVEYENVFPYQSASVSRRPEDVWSPEFLAKFLQIAATAEVEVIPLQQCLGHLQYAFQLPENQQFSVPQSELKDLNATQPEARQWLKKLLVEMLEAHPASRFIHLGMDEAGDFVVCAKATGQEPLALFLDYLEELCAVCESYGKTPLIWSDMLEDHIAPENIEQLRSFRERVILVPWNYMAGIRPESIVRFSGLRCSRQWLEDPQNAPDSAGPISDDLLHFEDWVPEIKRLTDKFQISPWLMEPLFQAAIWKHFGFTVWGGAGGSITQDRSVLPYYNWRAKNIRQWKETAERYQLEGLIMTEWRRSNSFSVPNVLPDVVWPILAGATNVEGSAQAFFPEVDGLDDLIFKLGKCREGWNIEQSLIEEMSQHEVREHPYEWKTMLLMLKVLQIHKKIADQDELISCYAGLGRANEVLWSKQSTKIDALRKQLLEIRGKVREHLKPRYHGEALEEWFYKVFSLPLETLDHLETSIKKNVATFQQRQAGHDFQA